MSPPLALDVRGPAAPPRTNGELVFAEPWESRAFGMAGTLADAGVFTWDEFRGHLVARIEAWGASYSAGDYYRCWLEALETLLVGAGTLGAADLADRSEHLAARPTGHDHTGPDHTGHDHTGPDHTGPDHTGHDHAGPDR